MSYLSLIVGLFILAALGIGAGLASEQMSPDTIVDSIDAANITDITLERVTSDPTSFIDVNSILTIVEAFVRYVVTFAVEVMKMGIKFGYENPQYFEPSFIVNLIRFIIYAVLVSLLIKPLMYLVIMIILAIVWIADRFKRRKSRKETEK